MKRPKLEVIKTHGVAIDLLHFQYEPDNFIKRFFPGPDKSMLEIVNTPHYRFIKLYQEIGGEIMNRLNETPYIRLMTAWGRDAKHNVWKAKRFIQTYNSIRKNGISKPIVILEEPLHQKTFEQGYEIYHGHHRSAVCAALGHKSIKSKVCRLK